MVSLIDGVVPELQHFGAALGAVHGVHIAARRGVVTLFERVEVRNVMLLQVVEVFIWCFHNNAGFECFKAVFDDGRWMAVSCAWPTVLLPALLWLALVWPIDLAGWTRTLNEPILTLLAAILPVAKWCLLSMQQSVLLCISTTSIAATVRRCDSRSSARTLDLHVWQTTPR